MMYAEGLSIRTVVGALHASGVLRHDQCRRANSIRRETRVQRTWRRIPARRLECLPFCFYS